MRLALWSSNRIYVAVESPGRLLWRSRHTPWYVMSSLVILLVHLSLCVCYTAIGVPGCWSDYRSHWKAVSLLDLIRCNASISDIPYLTTSAAWWAVGRNWHVLTEQAPIPGAQTYVPSSYKYYVSPCHTVCVRVINVFVEIIKNFPKTFNTTKENAYTISVDWDNPK